MEMVFILLAIFIILMLLRVPIAVSMGLSSLVGFMLIGYNLTTVGSTLYTAVASTAMITIPGYIFAGSIMANGGISKNLLEALKGWIGHVPGGIAIVTVLACALFAAITGSASATIAAVGGLMIPAMKESNYKSSFSTGLVASAGSLGILIPPSIPMILYTTIASVSVSKIFAAGMLPGLLVVVGFSVYIVIYSIIHNQKGGQVDKVNRWRKTLRAVPALLLPVAILGFIYSGVMTATEASAFACVYAITVSTLVYREYTWKKFVEAVKDATKSTAMILWIVTACSMFSQFLTVTRVPHKILEAVAASNLSANGLVLICCLILIFLGCFMDGVSIMLIAAPLMVPVVSGLGYDLIQFGHRDDDGHSGRPTDSTGRHQPISGRRYGKGASGFGHQGRDPVFADPCHDLDDHCICAADHRCVHQDLCLTGGALNDNSICPPRDAGLWFPCSFHGGGARAWL